MYISGTMDARWNNDELNPAFSSLTADDFEVIQLGWRGQSGPAAPTNLRIVPPSELTPGCRDDRMTDPGATSLLYSSFRQSAFVSAEGVYSNVRKIGKHPIHAKSFANCWYSRSG